MPAAKQCACTRSELVSGAQSSRDLRQLRTSCHERSRESERGWSWLSPERYSSAEPAPCGVTINGRMPTATCPSTTGRTSRAYSHAWITRQTLVRATGGRVPVPSESPRCCAGKVELIMKLRVLVCSARNNTSHGFDLHAYRRTEQHQQIQSGRAR